jgi:transposase
MWESEDGVGPRFVQGCQEAGASSQLAKRGLSIDENKPLPTPRFLGIDEFARRKGHRYDTILCDLDARQVLDVSAASLARRRRAPARTAHGLRSGGGREHG